MTTWFTSDTHFGHHNIIKFCPDTRKYASADEMDEAMIAKWNSQVKNDDTVYLLGDVFFHKLDTALKIIRRLNGKIHLIWGNHDQVIAKNPELQAEFASVQHYLDLTIDGVAIVLFHFPIYEWNKMHRGSYHLYGHVHGKVQVPGRAMDVGSDTYPDNGLWSWEEVHAKLKDIEIRPHH